MLKRILISILFVICLISTFSSSYAEEIRSINIRAGGVNHPYGSATVLALEYEHSVTEFVSLVPSLGSFEYDYEDGIYYEEGSSSLGLLFSVRFYPRRWYQEGFWFGPGLAIFDIDFEWTEEGYYRTYRGSGSYLGIAPMFGLGGKIKMGKNIYFDPSLLVGYLESYNVDADQGEPVATTVFAAFNLGVSFQF